MLLKSVSLIELGVPVVRGHSVQSLEMWATFIITIHTLQERYLYKQQYYDEDYAHK